MKGALQSSVLQTRWLCVLQYLSVHALLLLNITRVWLWVSTWQP